MLVEFSNEVMKGEEVWNWLQPVIESAAEGRNGSHVDYITAFKLDDNLVSLISDTIYRFILIKSITLAVLFS